MFDRNLFGSRLRELRILNRLSVQKLADAFTIHHSTVTNFEQGAKSPSIEFSVALADYFNVSLDYLVGRTDNPELLGIAKLAEFNSESSECPKCPKCGGQMMPVPIMFDSDGEVLSDLCVCKKCDPFFGKND